MRTSFGRRENQRIWGGYHSQSRGIRRKQNIIGLVFEEASNVIEGPLRCQENAKMVFFSESKSKTLITEGEGNIPTLVYLSDGELNSISSSHPFLKEMPNEYLCFDESNLLHGGSPHHVKLARVWTKRGYHINGYLNSHHKVAICAFNQEGCRENIKPMNFNTDGWVFPWDEMRDDLPKPFATDVCVENASEMELFQEQYEKGIRLKRALAVKLDRWMKQLGIKGEWRNWQLKIDWLVELTLENYNTLDDHALYVSIYYFPNVGDQLGAKSFIKGGLDDWDDFWGDLKGELMKIVKEERFRQRLSNEF